MKKLLTIWLAAAALGFSVASPGVFAQETQVSPVTEAAPAALEPVQAVVSAPDQTTTPTEAATAEATPAAEPAAVPVPDKGDTAWMMVATLLVIMMTVPGLALFYGGLVRSKNMHVVRRHGFLFPQKVSDDLMDDEVDSSEF